MTSTVTLVVTIAKLRKDKGEANSLDTEAEKLNLESDVKFH